MVQNQRGEEKSQRPTNKKIEKETTSTQNNHKHDAQVNIPRSTEKNVDSSKEKAKNNGLSKKAAASKAVSEVDAIQTKSSLQSSVSENNFEALLVDVDVELLQSSKVVKFSRMSRAGKITFRLFSPQIRLQMMQIER